MMGGLHIEMALLKVIGDFLERSGWAGVMTSAGVTTEGRADSLQKSSQTSRSMGTPSHGSGVAHPAAKGIR